MNFEKIESKIVNTVFFFLLILLINGRSLLGVYIFGFRIAELLTGLALLLAFFIIPKFNYFKNEYSFGVVLSFYLLIAYFAMQNILYGENFSNLYLYKSSVFIWFISYLFLGHEILKKAKLTKKYFIIGYVGLAIQYIFNVYYYPSFLTMFFNQYSDKTQFLKGAEIAIFFIIVTFFTNKFFQDRLFFDIFIIFSSLYVPLMFFKSRSGGFAIFVFVSIEIYKKRYYFKENLKRSFIVIFIAMLLILGSSHQIIGNPFEVEETPAAIEQVFKHKYIVSNTYDDEIPFLYFFENRLYSADGNLNWRLQLWQTVIIDSINNNEVLFGHGFGSKTPIFNNETFSGVDGLNENTHNYFLNIYVQGGLIALFLVLMFFANLFKLKNKNFSNSELTLYIIPLFLISMFDGSMENPYFAIVFYFFLSSFYSDINFVKREK